MSEAHGIYVGGEWRGSGSGRTYEKRSPWRPDVVTGSYAAAAREFYTELVTVYQDAPAS